jgi:hypothetical protein
MRRTHRRFVLVLLSRPLVVSLIPDLKPDNTGALVFGGWTIIAVALLAAYMPVRRAVRVDPMGGAASRLRVLTVNCRMSSP